MIAVRFEAPADRRARLARLDECLSALEDAHERDEVLVSPALAAELGRHAPCVAAGMRIADALDLVFREQERFLGSGEPSEPDDDQAGRWQLDAAEARRLTDRIKRAAHAVSLLLLEAHERGAWRALGYRSWETYVRSEFELSR